jgi:hypothetical protein
MNNAMVTVPLSEVDALRTKLEQAEYKVSVLETTEKKVKVEIRQSIMSAEREYVGGGSYQFRPVNRWQDHPHTYINMDDVIKPIREEEEQKVIENTRRLEKQVKESAETMHQMRERHQVALEELKATYIKEINEAKGIQAPLSEAQELQKVNKVLTERLVQAYRELNHMKFQGFWSRLFHPIR